MSEVFVTDKEVVVPGQVLVDGMDYLPAGDVYREGEKLYAMRLGLVNISGRVVKLIPLGGKYVPKRNDLVIGKVEAITIGGWRIDIGWVFEANLSLRDGSSDFIEKGSDLTRYFSVGDYVIAQIVNVAGSRIIDLSMKGPGLRKLGPGRLLKVSSSKVPRIIGKQGSMISMIKDMTGCRISVGQNGLVWLSGDDPVKEMKAVKAIMMIEEKSHISGLTDLIKGFLESEK